MNRIQFQKGLSLTEFLAAYGTNEQCETELKKVRWPQGFRCPKCGNAGYSVVWHGKRKHYQCSDCRVQTSVISGTIFQSTKLPLRTWFQGMYLLSQAKNNVSALELKRLLGICYRSAWRFKHKLIQVMAEREGKRRLEGRVEVVIDSFGVNQPGKSGGGRNWRKAPFIAAVQTDLHLRPRVAVFSPIPAVAGPDLLSWARARLVPNTLAASSSKVSKPFLNRSRFPHGARRFVTGLPRRGNGRFSWVEVVVANLKSSVYGTYHGFKYGKYLYRYLAETQYRFNRRFDLRALFGRLVRAAAENAPRTECWLRSVAEA